MYWWVSPLQVQCGQPEALQAWWQAQEGDGSVDIGMGQPCPRVLMLRLLDAKKKEVRVSECWCEGMNLWRTRHETYG